MALPFEGEELHALRTQWETGDGQAVYVVGPCSSTLDVAWALHAANEFAIWDSVVAASQWAGRGQMRRQWMSPTGNLYAAWRWPLPPKGWNTLVPLMAGVLVHDFFLDQGIALHIKWPNDLLFEGHKVGGILVEERNDVLLVGLGINLMRSPTPEEMRADTSMIAGNLSLVIHSDNLLALWAQLVSRGRFWYEKTLTLKSPAGFVACLKPLLAYMYQDVQVVCGEGCHTACLMDVQEDGSLVLDRQGHREVLYTGSILPCERERSPTQNHTI